MYTAQYFKDIATMLWNSYKHILVGNAVADDKQRWYELGTAALLAAQYYSRTQGLSVADKRKLEAAVGVIRSVVWLLRDNLNVADEPAISQNVAVVEGAGIASVVEPTSEESNIETADVDDIAAITWDDIDSAFENRIKTAVVTNRKHLDYVTFMRNILPLFEIKVKEMLEQHHAIKIHAVLAAEYAIAKIDEELKDIKYFNTKSLPIYSTTDLNEWFVLNVLQPISADMEDFQEQDSGWSLQAILNLTFKINKLNPMTASSYIQLPDFIARKKACINVINSDNQCFKWAILSALHPVHYHSNKVSSYTKYERELNFKGIEFPVDLKCISKFENQNTVSVNVYFLKKEGKVYKVLPRHLTSQKKSKHVNLLLVESYYVDENEPETPANNVQNSLQFHYVWIKDLSRLVRSQLTNHNHKIFICDRCLHYFQSNDKLSAHITDCENINQGKVVLPNAKNNILKFKNISHKNRAPFVVYGDFECLLKPVHNDERAYQQHEAYSVGFFVMCSFDDARSVYRSYKQSRDDNETPAAWFVKNLHSLALDLNLLYKNPKPMRKLTTQEETEFVNAKSCHICSKPFTPQDKRVRDHCHFTGEYRGPAHNSCNINYQDSRTVPVVFHNLSGYDSHLFIKEIATCFPGRVSIIPQTKEKYISFTKYVEGTDINLRFIDSFRFMASSLDKLSSYLEKMNILEKVFQQDDGFSSEQIALLKRKGVFPYDYVTALDKLNEGSLPSKADFYSSLYETDITYDDYRHAQKVWQVFNIQTLGQYSDLYLKTDILLLAEVFENFRSNCLEAYGLDPAHYYTTPGLTWDAMLKYTEVQLELLTDIDMLLFVERGIRGGISQCCNRYAKANNHYMKEDYNANEDEKYLMYYDVNNLYGWAMTEPLPYGGFKWVDNVEVPYFFNIPEDHPQGFILEVDLEYPQSLHDSHKDLPFCAEHMTPPESRQKKLMTTLHSKKRYVIHYRALQQALKHGLVLKKVHRALQFNQSAWLKKYIDLNSEKRKNAKNEFEKMLFKLFNNAVYGKTMENERKHVDVKLVNKWAGRYGAEALIARPNFHSCDIFDENLVAVQMMRSEVYIKKPIYIGLAVLDLSKTLVYRFHYDYMQYHVGDNCKLLYTDTDSLMYEVTNVNMYEIMKRDIQEFDTSDYAVNNQFNMPRANKKIVGLMKDECNGEIMLEFVGLRSKMYSVRVQNQKAIKKVKGVKTYVVQATIAFEDYISCLRENNILTREQHNIRSRHHRLHTERETKIALSAHDDKRYLQADTTDTLPWGHYRIKERVTNPVAKLPTYEESSAVAATNEIPPNSLTNKDVELPTPETTAVEPPNRGQLAGEPLYQWVLQAAELSRSAWSKSQQKQQTAQRLDSEDVSSKKI